MDGARHRTALAIAADVGRRLATGFRTALEALLTIVFFAIMGPIFGLLLLMSQFIVPEFATFGGQDLLGFVLSGIALAIGAFFVCLPFAFLYGSMQAIVCGCVAALTYPFLRSALIRIAIAPFLGVASNGLSACLATLIDRQWPAQRYLDSDLVLLSGGAALLSAILYAVIARDQGVGIGIAAEMQAAGDRTPPSS